MKPVDVARLRAHSDVFDEMLSLIPARFYYPQENLDAGGGMRAGTLRKRKQDQAANQQRKEASKKGKRARLAPGGQGSILDIQYDKFKSQRTGEPLTAGMPVSVSDLRAKLQGELAALSSKRKEKLPEWEERRRIRKEREAERAQRPGEAKQTKQAQPRARGGESEEEGEPEPDSEPEPADSEPEEGDEVQLGLRQEQAQLDGRVERKGKSKKKRLREAEEEESYLDSIENPEEKKRVLEEKSWDEALLKAQGQKVKTSSAILKKSLKREKKKKERSSQKWADRVKQVEEEKAERQERRKHNIEGHRQKKKDWLNGLKPKKAPGFEGKFTKNKPGKKQKQKKDRSQKSNYKKFKV